MQIWISLCSLVLCCREKVSIISSSVPAHKSWSLPRPFTSQSRGFSVSTDPEPSLSARLLHILVFLGDALTFPPRSSPSTFHLLLSSSSSSSSSSLLLLLSCCFWLWLPFVTSRTLIVWTKWLYVTVLLHFGCFCVFVGFCVCVVRLHMCLSPRLSSLFTHSLSQLICFSLRHTHTYMHTHTHTHTQLSPSLDWCCVSIQ